MSYLFDTSAISEVFRKHPEEEFVAWLSSVERADQFTSTIVLGELYAGAFGASSPDKWLDRIETHTLPRLTVLPFDQDCARVYGRIRAELRAAGTPIGDADTMIAATAVTHNLEVVTANVKHFARVSELRVRPVNLS